MSDHSFFSPPASNRWPRRRILTWLLVPLALFLPVAGSCGFCSLRFVVQVPTPDAMLTTFCADLNKGDLHSAYQFIHLQIDISTDYYGIGSDDFSEERFDQAFPLKKTFGCRYEAFTDEGSNPYCCAGQVGTHLVLVLTPKASPISIHISLNKVFSLGSSFFFDLSSLLFRPEGTWRIVTIYCRDLLNYCT